MEAHRFTITEDEAGRRLDVVVADRLGISRSKAAALFASRSVSVGGEAASKSYRTQAREPVEVLVAVEPVSDESPPEVEVVHADDDVLVVAKPAGVVVHAAPGVREPTLVDALVAAGHELAPRGGTERPGIVHRIDRDVSGLLVVAKTDTAHRRLVEMLKRRDVTRIYLAAVAGSPEVDRGKIDAPVGRHPRHRTRMAVLRDGKDAVTWFRVLERFGDEASLCEVRLETGRTHQIRIHLASITHPILGDAAYGHDPRLGREIGLERPFLHAHRLSFVHPVTDEEMSFTLPLPSDLEEALEALRERERRAARPWTPQH